MVVGRNQHNEIPNKMKSISSINKDLDWWLMDSLNSEYWHNDPVHVLSHIEKYFTKLS